MKQQLKNLIERVLIARPEASVADMRSLVPALRDKSDEDIEKLISPMRTQRGRNSGRT